MIEPSRRGESLPHPRESRRTDPAAQAWGALGEPSRRAIMRCLADRPRTVAEIARELPISRGPAPAPYDKEH
jgi:DNA-binding transcriptional ArsR family regulator